jgi:2-polyprenyl-3-methyl-5-hydroxy-6-metoxy-1,4-benzoquinol methylase
MEREVELTAKIESFDSFWEAPEDVERGYASFYQFYKRNYLPYFPKDKRAQMLVVSCGPGYLVNLLTQEGYLNVLGIDSMPEKVKFAEERKLNCIVAEAFPFITEKKEQYDVIFVSRN